MTEKDLTKNAKRAILSTWSRYQIDEIIRSYFPDEEYKIDFILSEYLIEDWDDYLNFKNYPSHKEALIKGGFIESET
jgi:hypothetical protein